MLREVATAASSDASTAQRDFARELVDAIQADMPPPTVDLELADYSEHLRLETLYESGKLSEDDELERGVKRDGMENLSLKEKIAWDATLRAARPRNRADFRWLRRTPTITARLFDRPRSVASAGNAGEPSSPPAA